MCVLTPYLPSYEYQSEEYIHLHKHQPNNTWFPSPIEFLHSLMHFLHCFKHSLFPVWFLISKEEKFRNFCLLDSQQRFFFFLYGNYGRVWLCVNWQPAAPLKHNLWKKNPKKHMATGVLLHSLDSVKSESVKINSKPWKILSNKCKMLDGGKHTFRKLLDY